MPVGWNCTHSMSMTSAPAQMAMAWPSPVDSHELDVYFHDLPIDRRWRGRRPWRVKSDHLAGRAPVADRARDAALGVGQQAQDLALHEDVDAHGDDLLLQRADQLQAGAVADVGQAGVAVAAEVALEDAAVLGAVEERAPALELVDPVGRLLGVELRHAPVVEHLAAAHGVAEVDLPVVLGPDVAHGGGHAALGHDGVRLAEQRLADERRRAGRAPWPRWRRAGRRRRRR